MERRSDVTQGESITLNSLYTDQTSGFLSAVFASEVFRNIKVLDARARKYAEWGLQRSLNCDGAQLVVDSCFVTQVGGTTS